MALPFRGNSGGGGRFNPRFQRQQEPEHRINERIRVPQVRLVGDNVTVGVYPTQEALKIAQSLELDLVEISPQADPPVCLQLLTGLSAKTLPIMLTFELVLLRLLLS